MTSSQDAFKWSETRLGSRFQLFFHLISWWSPTDFTTVVFYGAVQEEDLRPGITGSTDHEYRSLELD